MINQLIHSLPKATTTNESNKEVLNPKYEEWRSIYLLLRSWIIGTWSEEAFRHIIGQNAAYEVWCCLEEAYLQATKKEKFS